MDALSPQGAKIIEYLAQKYGVSTGAVMALLHAVSTGDGIVAHFSHPELGGLGQWSRGGMTMIGDASNASLKAKVDGLCSELADLLGRERLSGEFRLFVPGVRDSSGEWWDAGLGTPTVTGLQNNVRYAWFRAARRLAIKIADRVFIYDTRDHEISGISQQQSEDPSLTFVSQYGAVRLAELRGVTDGVESQSETRPANRLFRSGSPGLVDDVFVKLERLAELREKGVISDEEFAAKKSELLERL